MNLSLEVFGVNESVDRFQGMERRSQNLEPVFAAVADEFFDAERSVFGGSPDLIRTGELRDALTGGSQHQVRRITPDELIAGTDIWYAIFHKERILEPVDDVMIRRWQEMFGDYIVTGALTSRLGL